MRHPGCTARPDARKVAGAAHRGCWTPKQVADEDASIIVAAEHRGATSPLPARWTGHLWGDIWLVDWSQRGIWLRSFASRSVASGNSASGDWCAGGKHLPDLLP